MRQERQLLLPEVAVSLPPRVQPALPQQVRRVLEGLEGLVQQVQPALPLVHQQELGEPVQQGLLALLPLRRLPITMRAPRWRPKLPLVSSSS